ncbi:MAG: hypothetical protein HYT63_01260 [Candidatus Yanofskybacteria bacterium]|nr:hypothetical protein [Candidatus Yanofskybacteria bacterium]
MITNAWKLDEDSNFVQDPIEDSETDSDNDLEDGDEKEAGDDDVAETVEDTLN